MSNTVKSRVSFRNWVQRAVAGACLLSLTGCATAPPSSSTNHRSSSALEDGVNVGFSVSPFPPVARHPVSVTVTVAGTKSKVNKVHDVWISETMSGMSMPKMDVSLNPVSQHRFSNTTLFVMQGTWKIFIHFKIGSTTYVRSFPVEVKA